MKSGHEKIIIKGTKFNRWIVLKAGKIEQKSRQRLYLCQCSCNSKPRYVRSSQLRYGNSKSCGCLRVEKHREATEKTDTAFRNLLRNYKVKAKKRSLNWELTDEQFRRLTSSNCFYTGRPPVKKYISGFGNEYVYNGIDRKNNSKGYTVDNCVPCCKEANWAKQNMNLEEFLNFVEEIHNHRRMI